jgi:putative ABC transport system permease protein
VLNDIRFGLRRLLKNPGFTLVALATLAAGIGVNGTVFTITNAIMFKGLPFANADRIVYLSMQNTQRADQFVGVSFPDFRDWRARARSYEGMAAFSGTQLNVGGDDNLSEVYPAAQLTANGFSVIGVRPVLGRDFTSRDDQPGAPGVTMLTYGLWQRRYGKDPAVIGKVVRINGAPTTIVGVMPADFTFPFNVDLWIPLPTTPNSEKRDVRNLGVYAALREGTSVASARAELATMWADLQRAYPATGANFTARVQTYQEQVVGSDLGTIFYAMLVAVGFVLLIACANVANLQLGRAVGRAREIAMRVAIGATRGQIVRQLLVESVLLSLGAGLVGLVIAYWGARAFDLTITPMGKPRWMVMSLDARVLAYLASISLGTGILFGLVPALRLSRLEVHTALKDGSRGAGTGARNRRLAATLVVTELALAVVLLAGAGLMIRSFLNVYRAPLGVNSSHVLTARLALPIARYSGPERQVAFYERLKGRLEAVPGVSVAAIGTTLPTGGSMTLPYELDGAPAVDPQRRQTLAAIVVSPDYFRVWEVKPVRGRAFTEADGVTGPPVVLVNEAFASKIWPNEDALAKRLRVFNGPNADPWLSVVGVMPNIVHNDISPRKIDPVIYLPYRQKPMAGIVVIARTTVLPGTLSTAFRREIQTLDADLPIFNLWTMEERLQRNYSFTGVIGSLFVIFAVLALLLASVGLYAVIAYSVSQRVQEIGVRMALGATARAILRLVFQQGLLQLAIGLAIGLAGAVAMTRVLRSVLIGVSPGDPSAFLLAAAVLALTAAFGTFLPARRAMRVDPVVALRDE